MQEADKNTRSCNVDMSSGFSSLSILSRMDDTNETGCRPCKHGEFPRIMGTILGVPITRTIAFWGLYWGPPILGNYPVSEDLDSITWHLAFSSLSKTCFVRSCGTN